MNSLVQNQSIKYSIAPETNITQWGIWIKCLCAIVNTSSFAKSDATIKSLRWGIESIIYSNYSFLLDTIIKLETQGIFLLEVISTIKNAE